MTPEDKLLRLFFHAHGTVSKSCSLKIVYDADLYPKGVAVMKDGNVCWIAGREELLFEYVTKDFKAGAIPV